jgi:signal transduction histidine kinase
MLFKNNPDVDDLGLLARYYRLRDQYIYYEHVLENYKRYGALAPVLAQFSSLCAGFVHDLGNGLNVIRSRLERLSYDLGVSKSADHPLNHAIAFCEACGWRLYALTEISPSRAVHAEPINLPVWIPRLLKSLSVLCPPSVKVTFQSSASRMIVAEYDNKLRVALMEVLLNAFVAVGEGRPGRISVSLCRCGGEAADAIEEAQIEVTDSGPGFPRRDSEELFDLRFTTSSRRYGLGLYLARKIVQKHRGQLILQSAPTGGARVIVRLPLGDPEPVWEDEHALMLALEQKWDEVAAQRQAIKTYMETYDLDRERLLTQLSDLFGQLSLTVVESLAVGLEGIQASLGRLTSGDVSDDSAGASAGAITGGISHDVQFIHEKCEYCTLLLGNARALNPDGKLEDTPLDLNQMVSRVTELMAWRVQPETDVHINLAPGLPRVQADAALLATAYLDLLRNALDAAGPDGRVDVESFFLGSTGGLCRTSGLDSVSDAATKMGIRLINTLVTPLWLPLSDSGLEQELTRMFDLDYTTRQGRAFGLGLHTARAIVEAHGGTITISELRDGRLRMALTWKPKRLLTRVHAGSEDDKP